jgi:hypothetical protein
MRGIALVLSTCAALVTAVPAIAAGGPVKQFPQFKAAPVVVNCPVL